MSNTYSAGMQAQLSSAVSKLATCILLTRTDGLKYGFTTHDKLLVIDGVRYAPAVSFNPSDISSNLNLDADDISAEALLDSTTLTEDDLRAGRWDYAAFRVFQVNWNDLTMGDKKDRAGKLGQVTVGRQVFIAELLGLMAAYTVSIGEVTTPGCRANLGDQRCKVDLTGGSPTLTIVGTVTTDYGDFFTIADSSRTEADGYFQEGVITFTSGLALGLSYELKYYGNSGGVMITKTPIAYNVAGATYAMSPGCDKQRTTCRDRFNNVVNFRGEPWLRGNDAMVQVGRHG